MPFTATTILHPSQTLPDVRIFFSGLLILEPLPNNKCEVRVHRSATAHHLTIEVRRKAPGRPDEIIMRHAGPLAFVGPEDNPQNPPIHGLLIERITGGEGVKMYTGGAVGPNGEERFTLAIDMAGAMIHNGNRPVDPDLVTGQPCRLLDIDPLASRPSILLNDGILHTASTVSPVFTFTLKNRLLGDRVLPRFASLIGANIYLNAGENLLLSWRQLGKTEQLSLLKPAAGVSYEIRIVNDPLFENDSITNPALNPKHDEFAEYYKLFTRVPSQEQFRMKVERDPAAPPPDKGTTMIPCMPVNNDGGGGPF